MFNALNALTNTVVSIPANHTAQNQGTYGDNWLHSIPHVAGVLIVGFVLGLFAHILAKRRDRDNRLIVQIAAVKERKRSFRAAINGLCEDVLAAKDESLFIAHQKSLPLFREECAKIEADISDVKAFRLARDAYRRFTLNDIEDRDHNARPPKPVDEHGNYVSTVGWKPRCRYEMGRQRIKESLDAICKLAE